MRNQRMVKRTKLSQYWSDCFIRYLKKELGSVLIKEQLKSFDRINCESNDRSHSSTSLLFVNNTLHARASV
jgi:hypothetical protein